ncbi:MAG: TadE family protein [Planctomycetota bacterium]
MQLFMQWTADISTAQTSATPASQLWWWETLTSGPAVTCLAIAGVCVVLLVVMGWRLRRLSPARARGRRTRESGVATIEFVLVAPFLLTVTLILIQTMLVFTGLFYVNYSAYAAARSAIVYIPADIGADGPNVLTPIEGGFKFDRIRSAAIIAVMPVSGQEQGDLQAASALVQGLNRYYGARGQTAPGWVNNLAEGRLNYAASHTTVTMQSLQTLGDGTVIFSDITDQVTFGPKEAIGVQVRHEFALTVPVASQLFMLSGRQSDGANSGSYNPQSRNTNGSPPPPGTWTVIRARAVLTNEGIDRTLPPRPRVPRR